MKLRAPRRLGPLVHPARRAAAAPIVRQWSRPRASLLSPAVMAVAGAVLLGSVLRLMDLGGVPPALNQDEAVYGYDAYSLFQTGRDHLGHPFPFTSLETFGDWSSPLLTYLSIPAVALFGLRTEVLRAVSAVIGVLAIPIVYLLAVELFRSRSVGVAAAWVLALTPWHVHLSRWAIIPTVVPTMVALTLLLLVRAAHRRGDRGIVAALLVAGMTVAGYHAMKVYVPLLLAAYVLVYRSSLLRIRREALLYAALVFTVIAGPILYLTVRDPGGGARIAQTSVFNERHVSPVLLATHYLAYFSPRFLFRAGDGDPMHSLPGRGIEPWSTLPLVVAGLGWLLADVVRRRQGRDGRPAAFLLLALALYPAPGSITVPNPHTLRAAHLIPLYALVAAVGAVTLARLLRRLMGRIDARYRRVVLGALAGLAVLTAAAEAGGAYRSYFTAYPDQVARDFQYGMQASLAYARAHAREYDEIWVTDANEPYIYVLFFNRWPPSDVHRNLQVRRDPPWFNEVDAIGMYRFGMPPNVDLDTFAMRYASTYPHGGIAYEARGGVAADGRRILVIHRP